MPLESASRALLLAAVERPPCASASRIASLAREVADWDPLLTSAEEHRVAPLLLSRLTAAGAPIPAAALEHLHAEYQRNLVRAMTNAAELLAILQEFARAAIPALPFKGVVLGASVYGDLAIRPAGDIDLLLRRSDLQTATRILLGRGYHLETELLPDGSPIPGDPCEFHFERADGMVLELRWRLELTPVRFRRDLNFDWAWRGHRTTLLAGAPVPDMAPETALLALCMHGGKHVWSRLIWVVDIAQLLAANPALDWGRALREARRTGLHRAVALGVLLASDLAAAPVAPAVLHRLRRDAPAERLARHFVDNLIDFPGIGPAGSIPFNVRLLAPPDRLRLLLSSGFLRPNEHDRAFLSLPAPLRPLYYLIRPWRILRDRTPR